MIKFDQTDCLSANSVASVIPSCVIVVIHIGKGPLFSNGHIFRTQIDLFRYEYRYARKSGLIL